MVSQVKGVNVTNLTAASKVPLDKLDRELRINLDKVTVATTSVDETGDSILLNVIPSNAKIQSVEFTGAELDTNGSPALDLNFGLFYYGDGEQAKLGKVLGDVVDADCIAADSDVGTAARPDWVDVLADKADARVEAWEMAGLSSDPGGNLVVGMTVGTNPAATDGSGDIQLKVTYIV